MTMKFNSEKQFISFTHAHTLQVAVVSTVELH